MFRRIAMLAGVFTLLSASTSLAQELLGIEQSGNVIRIDKTTGTGTLIGFSGFVATNSAASDSSGRMFTIIGIPGGLGQLIEIDPATGAGSVALEFPGCPSSVGVGVRGMAFDSSDTLFVVLDVGDFSDPDVLATIDTTTGACSEIGAMGLTGVQALAFDSADNLFCLDVFVPKGLCSVDKTTGIATKIAVEDSLGDNQALEFDTDGTLFGARANLVRIDPVTGARTIVGATGFTDIRGLAFVGPAGPQVQIVEIDVNPGNGPDCFNNDGRGTIAVAIFGNANLDVGQIDLSTVALEGLPVAMNGPNFRARITDINKDAIADLLVGIEDIAGAFPLGEGTAVLTGALLDGTLIEGSDTICVVQ